MQQKPVAHLFQIDVRIYRRSLAQHGVLISAEHVTQFFVGMGNDILRCVFSFSLAEANAQHRGSTARTGEKSSSVQHTNLLRVGRVVQSRYVRGDAVVTLETNQHGNVSRGNPCKTHA